MSLTARARSLARDAARLNLEQVDLPGSLRCIVGVMVPLAIGLSAGSVADGVYASIGALCAGFASFQGAYRRRAAITIVVGAGMAAATITGAIAGRADWAAIAVVAAWGLVVGMLPAFGQAALVVGLQWGVAVIIVNALPMSTGQALVRGAMILAGALVQTLLVVLAWPMRTYRPERTAVAAAYRELAAYAESVQQAAELSLPTTLVDEARGALADPHPLGRASQILAFQALVDEAERLRISFAALSVLRGSLDEGPAREGVDRLCLDAAAALRSVATAVLADMPPAGAQSITERLQEDLDQVDRAAGLPTEPVADWHARDTSRMAHALAGQLRSAVRTAEQSAVGPSGRDAVGGERPRRRHHDFAQAVITLRANLSWQSGVFRHAVRLATTLTAAMIVFRLTGLAHGYWIALTVLLVLRQDYATTAVRGVSRIVGTMLGAVLATLLVAGLHPDVTGLAVMFGIAAWIAFMIVRVNYALFSVVVTVYVVFLLAFSQAPALATAGDRLLATLAGGALALGAYLAWPTWESRLVGPQLGDLLDAQAAYAGGVLECQADPRSPARQRLGDLRTRARLARSNAELSVRRMSEEPERSRRDAPVPLDTARGILAAARRSSLAVLTMHAHLPAEDAASLEQLHPFAGAVVGKMRHAGAQARRLVPPAPGAAAHEVLAAVARSSRRRERAPHDHPDYELRDRYQAMAAALRDLPDAPERPIALLLEETDELVDAVNSVTELLEADMPAPVGEG